MELFLFTYSSKSSTCKQEQIEPMMAAKTSLIQFKTAVISHNFTDVRMREDDQPVEVNTLHELGSSPL